MNPLIPVVLSVLGALIIVGVAFAVRRRSRRSSEIGGVAGEIGQESGKEEIGHPEPSAATIVMERLPDAELGELMNDAIPIDPLSELASQVRQTAGPGLQFLLAARAVAEHRGRFLVEFSAEGTAALKSGGVTLLQRVDGRLQPTLVRGQSIAENATLVKRGGQVVTKAAAVAHVAILLAVQAQLVSMQRTLERIDAKLDALRRFLDDQQVARVRANMRKLAEVRDEIGRSEDLGDAHTWLVVLEAADVAFLEIEELAKRQCGDAAARLEEARVEVKMFGPSGDVLLGSLWNERDRYELYGDLRALAVAGRLAVAQLKAACGRQMRLDRLERDVEDLAAEAARHRAFLERRGHEFRTLFRSRAHQDARRGELFDAAAKFQSRSEAAISALRAELQRLGGAEARAVRTIVEIDEVGTVRPIALIPGEVAR